MHPKGDLRLSKKWSFRASAHTGVGIPPDDRNIIDSENIGFPKILGDRQEVNCPEGKRDHPGVHQPAGWFAMTVVFLTR